MITYPGPVTNYHNWLLLFQKLSNHGNVSGCGRSSTCPGHHERRHLRAQDHFLLLYIAKQVNGWNKADLWSRIVRLSLSILDKATLILVKEVLFSFYLDV